MNQKNIRNFVIISHIDHGKSTLADRFLELTGTIPQGKFHPQHLDSMNLEKEKGITIKLHPVMMHYLLSTKNYQLNLIDTPGHIDFNYETSRALACVEGAILLVDAVKGIQAQTIFNLEMARKQHAGFSIIGAVNKIDLPNAQVEETRRELASVLNVKEEEIFLISAKTGQNIKNLLETLVEKVSPPKIPLSNDFKALIFDSKYDLFSGVVAFIRVFSGEIKRGDEIYFLSQQIKGEVKEVGYFTPELKPCPNLQAGEIGYIKTGVREAGKIKIGDTLSKKNEGEPLPGYKEPQPVLFLSLYPENGDEFSKLKQGLEKLKLSDPSLVFQPESKTGLGQGMKVGFLGSLQAEIILRRLKEEFDLDIVSTIPRVALKSIAKGRGEFNISSLEDWDEFSGSTFEVQEPWVKIEIITPNVYFNQLFKLLRKFNISLGETKSFTSSKSILEGIAPLREIINGNFYDEVKAQSEGYASFNFSQISFEKADLVKMDILIGGKKENLFSKIVSKEKAFSEGKSFLKKLKEVLPPQQFSLSLQAAIGGKIIARETINARRKDVTAPLYGGDYTRKRKLLEAQKRGKKKLKGRAKIRISPEDYLKILK